ncbi:hypothetical protein DH86_00002962 [Scytalidium sp. 3C]|nr:hypothetical protein DH86_00002962 [Scytalidium sp. 3C]
MTRTAIAPKTSVSNKPKPKEKAHKSEPEQRYPWLANLADMDRNPVGHPDYDPRTVYIPPMAWTNFSAFEKQYWEIKQKFWDTIVFFKKGKFYELYENDATIGHQLFDLKLTDRVNMRMVGVPESSLDHWANQFVAKGYKIARVDQCESALGKEMRERDGSATASKGKADKIIRRELACVLTGGTLVDGSMLQDDMATFCVAIKESTVDSVPTFGIAMVDAATGQFFISEFVDDADLTKFETFVAQTRPQELLLEKSCISTKALRILKNNTSPTTIWNYLKTGKEFWSAEITRRELDCSGYFTSEDSDGQEIWPDRLDAVDMLIADQSMMGQFSASMTRMPDLERLISRIHAGSCRVEDFVRVLEGFEQIEYTMSLLGAFNGGAAIIDRLLSSMPDLKKPLAWWESAFDRQKAKDLKILIPERGVEEDFDASQDRIEEIESELENLLQKQRRDLKSKNILYKAVGKEVYQLEVPTAIKVPKEWSIVSSAKGVKRYYFPELKRLVRDLAEAQETHGQVVKEVTGRFYTRFDKDYSTWLQAVKVIAQLDCLISLAAASASLGEPSCRPVFVDAERSVVEFEELRHPCMLPNVTDFIPNDVKLGGDDANITLLTGANAAGKSTVLRMTCIAVIMAQIGCYVPCISAKLTPVDRIMSRLGANDNIFAAQSTFFVELSETKKILSEATPRSLVILDELGRGTSSYDGVAVAQAVLHHVATHIGCTGFFATHYHSLATEFAGHPEITPKRMQIQVDEDNRRVTFLYKLEAGVAEGSFGMHCAAMCGIPAKVIDRAEIAAREWEHTSRLKESLEKARSGCYIPLGMQSDVSWILKDTLDTDVEERGLNVLIKAIQGL